MLTKKGNFLLFIGSLLLSMGLLLHGSAAADHDPTDTTPDPIGVRISLNGCRFSDLPAGYDLEDNDFVCTDDAYTGGNLLAGWNELDLVPHRVTFTAGNSAPATQTYTVAITADNIDGGVPGYDFITEPVLNTTLSHASCELTFGGLMTLSPGVGGTDSSLYRFVTITQDDNTVCVIDYQERLAVGASEFSGSSLHSNLLNHRLGTAGVGAQDVSIPVAPIQPQELDKDMSATQDATHIWNLTKEPSPATVSFNDTCSTTPSDLRAAVDITVSWERLAAAAAGQVTVVTNIYVTNPASRTITVNVTDLIYGDPDGLGEQLLDAKAFGAVNVPANTANFLVGTHSIDVPAGTTGLRDKATATYTDLVTGVAVPGTTEAEASATVQPSGVTLNQTAVINDVENITGSNLTFDVDYFTPATSGSFDNGYTADTKTTGPVSWTSITQSDTGSVTFRKNIYVGGPVITTGSLSDTAKLEGSDGYTKETSAEINITTNAKVQLTIEKTIPNILQGADTASFTFDVAGPDSYSNAVTIDFAAGETTKSTTLNGLVPGNYTVSERAVAGWENQANKNINLNLPTCSGKVSFTNAIIEAKARVKKITLPAGQELGWSFTLNGPGTPGETVATTGAGYVDFSTVLEEGTYTVTEQEQLTWDITSVNGDDTATSCSFTVNYPADANKTFSCDFENTKRGKIIIDKVTNPAKSTQSFEFNPSYSDTNFSLTDGATPHDSGYLVPGTYSVAELPVDGWDLTGTSCQTTAGTGTSTDTVGSITLEPGETVTCTFTNTQRGMVTVHKLTKGVVDPARDINFTLYGPGLSSSSINDSTFGDTDGTLDFDGAKLLPGETYTVCENPVPAGWTSFWWVDSTLNGMYDNGEEVLMPYNPGASSSPPEDLGIRCYDFTVEPGETLNLGVENDFPGGDPRTIGYWKNWNMCSGGNQSAVAAKNGGAEEGFFIVEDLLPQQLGDLPVEDCETAVYLLDKRDLSRKHQKRANDAAYGMAAQLMAAQLNLAAGAITCTEVQDAVVEANDLLKTIGFNGEGSYLDSKVKGAKVDLRAEAIQLATTLDEYNNGNLCN